MGNGLLDISMKINESGLLKNLRKRQKKQSATAKALGLEDPYAKKKKKKKKGGNIRFFMDKFIKNKEDRINKQ